jgi:hypothetical protein
MEHSSLLLSSLFAILQSYLRQLLGREKMGGIWTPEGGEGQGKVDTVRGMLNAPWRLLVWAVPYREELRMDGEESVHKESRYQSGDGSGGRKQMVEGSEKRTCRHS